jgi:hypothetical protein
MPETTTNRGYPRGVVTDNILDTLDVGPTADAIDVDVQALYTMLGAAPSGDSSNSVFLTGADIAFTANDNKNILTTGTVTLARDQWVYLSAKVRATNAGGNIGFFGCYIDVDSVLYPELESGVLGLGTTSPTDRRQFSIPGFSVFLTAGAHTFRLRGDRDSAVTTINAQASDALNQTYHPTSLTVIV